MIITWDSTYLPFLTLFFLLTNKLSFINTKTLITYPQNMDTERMFTLSQVAQHKSKQDCWIIIHGRVIDVTKFLEEHPGGEEVLIESAGKDATKEFEDIGHSKAAKNYILKYQIGYLQGYKIQDDDDDNLFTDSYKEPMKAKEIEAFVIKQNSKPKHLVFVEYFVPFLAAAFFLYYRYLNGALQL
ncbi:hypothetical protein AABB24_008409 [Solanum stoloniferum]|uniref:Cytochrome b5 heme-binding domain-containing protein n=1 Tax=Solanum stoloniferum TaxID=62892 RepID=A0ABD2USN9_9SOLN